MRIIVILSPTGKWGTKTGTVRIIRMTEKQYSSIHLLTGEADYQEKTVGANCHIML